MMVKGLQVKIGERSIYTLRLSELRASLAAHFERPPRMGEMLEIVWNNFERPPRMGEMSEIVWNNFERPPRMGEMSEIVWNNFERTGETRRMTTNLTRSSELNSPGTLSSSDSGAT